MAPFDQLLSPLELAPGVALRNRIVMPPLVIWRADESAEVNDAHRRHYRQSSPGCGMVIVEATTVSPEGRLAATQLGIFDDRHVSGLGDLANIIREAGAVPGIQIHHAGGKTNREKTYGETPLVPSVLPGTEADVAELTDAEIERIIAAFADGARRAVEAGFGVIEIHGAHGYLGAQFLSPRTNRRTDAWGGAPGPGKGLSGRLRFLRRVAEEALRAIDGRALLSCRLGAAEAASKEGDPPGLTIEEGVQAARELVEAGMDLIHVSYANSPPEAIDSTSGFASTLQLSRPVAQETAVPVIAVTGITTPEEAEAALTEGYGQMIAVGRGILADPGWAAKVVSGRPGEIERCVHCEPRCFHHSDATKCPSRRRLGIGPPGQ
jgi:NADPH2 dehydrogenase